MPLGARAEICQLFSLVKKLFWNYRTFSGMHLGIKHDVEVFFDIAKISFTSALDMLWWFILKYETYIVQCFEWPLTMSFLKRIKVFALFHSFSALLHSFSDFWTFPRCTTWSQIILSFTLQITCQVVIYWKTILILIWH